MSSQAKERAERFFRQPEERAEVLTEYQAKEEATRQLTAKLRVERLARETSSKPEGVREKSRMMPNKLHQLRKEQLRGSRARIGKRGHRSSEKALRKESEKWFYGKLGPASPVKRIDPKTGEVVEIISTTAAPIK
jgi:hypothetical protein